MSPEHSHHGHGHAAHGRVGWLDCAAGASGDMFLGALVDAGVALDVIAEAVDRIAVEPIELTAETTDRHGIGATRVVVHTAPDPAHRTWGAVRDLLDDADLPEPVARLAHDAFARLAAAEGAVHRMPVDEVHFHEVGALDAIADVVGTAAGLHALGLDRLVVSPVRLGGGTTRGSHGVIPLPAPAVLELMRAAGAPCEAGTASVELCTPTGAALLTAAADDYGPMPPMTVRTIGAGAGSRDLAELPNLLRLVVGDAR